MKQEVNAVKLADIRGKELMYLVIGEGEKKVIVNVGEKTWKSVNELNGVFHVETKKTRTNNKHENTTTGGGKKMKNLWRTKNTYIDAETGEIIEKEKALKEYTIINKTKTVSHEDKKYAGTVEYTIECRRKQWEQQTITFD